jgi:hypothetical protein
MATTSFAALFQAALDRPSGGSTLRASLVADRPGDMSETTAASILSMVDADWVTARLLRPEAAALLDAIRQAGASPIDAVVAKRFQTWDRMVIALGSGDHAAFVAAAGEDLAYLVRWVIWLSFHVYCDELHSDPHLRDADEVRSLNKLGDNVDADALVAVAKARQALAGNGLIRYPDHDAACHFMVPQGFEHFKEKTSEKGANVVSIERGAGKGAALEYTSARKEVLARVKRRKTESGTYEVRIPANLAAELHAQVSEVFSNPRVHQFLACSLLLLTQRIDAAELRGEAKAAVTPYDIEWEDFNAVGQFVGPDSSEAHERDVRESLTEFFWAINTASVTGEFDGIPLSNAGFLHRVELWTKQDLLDKNGRASRANRTDPTIVRGQFARATLSLGMALAKPLYGVSGSKRRYTTVSYGALLRAVDGPLEERRACQMYRALLLAIAIRGNRANVKTAKSLRGQQAGIIGAPAAYEAWWTDPARRKVAFSAKDLDTLIGSNLVTPVAYKGPNAAKLVARDRRDDLRRIRSIVTCLLLRRDAISAHCFVEASTEPIANPDAPLIVVEPNPHGLHGQAGLAGAAEAGRGG